MVFTDGHAGGISAGGATFAIIALDMKMGTREA